MFRGGWPADLEAVSFGLGDCVYRSHEHVTTGPVDATVLVVMNRGAIVRALGEPGRCQVAPMTICDPNTRPVQCRQEMQA